MVVSLRSVMLSPDVKLHRLSVADVYHMADAGILREDQRVELLDGVLVDPSTRRSTCASRTCCSSRAGS